MNSFFQLLRPVNCAMASVAVLIGAYLGGIGAALPLYLAMVSAFLISGGGMVVNDYYDRRLDSVFDPEKPIPSGKISLRGASVLSFLLFALGLYLAFWINLPAFSLAALNSLLLVLYAGFLQKRFFFSNMTVSFLVGSTFVYGGLAVGNILPAFLLGLMAFFANTSREILKDMEDMYADAGRGIRSIPIVLDKEKSRVISAVFTLVAISMTPLPLIMGVFGLLYIIAVVPSVLVFVYSIKLTFGDGRIDAVQRSVKLAMVLGLVAFLAGAL